MRRLVVFAVAAAAVTGAAAPALASTLPVTVHESTDGGVFVGVDVNNQPGAGVAVANGRACAGISYEVPQCVTLPGVAVQKLPVTVHESTKGGVFVGVDVNDQPGVGVAVANGRACVGISEQLPVCVGVPPITIGRPAADTRQKLPVVVYHDDTRTAVGVDDIGVVIYSNGRICPVVSTQDWPCVSAELD